MGATCDVCNAPTFLEIGTAYSADEFRALVARGFGPDEAIVRRAATFGVSRDVAVRQWTDDLVARSTTGWLLCPSCTARAATVQPHAPSGLQTGPAVELLEPQAVSASAVPSGLSVGSCSQCGAAVSEANLFCARCGHDLRAPAASPAPSPRPAWTTTASVPPPARGRRTTGARTALLVAGAALLVVVGIVLTGSASPRTGEPGASTATVGTSPTAVASEDTPPDPSLSPPLQAGAVAQWDGTPVTTVCLTGNQGYEQEPDFRFPVNAWLKSLLAPVGVAITGAAGPCDATLKVSIRLVGTPAAYGTDAVKRYTGIDRQVTVSLTAADRKPIVFEDSYRAAPGELATDSDPATPHEFLVDQSRDIARDLLEAASEIWGMAVAIEALCLPGETDPYVSLAFDAEQRLLDASSLRDALGGASPVPNDYASWRRWFETGQVVEGEGGSAGCR